MNEVKKILRRLSLLYWLAFFAGILIVGRIVLLQFFPPDYTPSNTRISKVEANRGNILSHNGRVLATSQTLYELRADFKTEWLQRDLSKPKDAKKKRERDSLLKALPVALANFFKDKPAEEYKKIIDRALKSTPRNTKNYRREKIVPRDVNYLELQIIKKFPLWSKAQAQGGLMAREYSKREYPYQSARQAIGVQDANKSISFGIEGHFDKDLRGSSGEQMEQKVEQGWMPIHSQNDKKAVNGYDVVSTIDINIQDAVETALRKQLEKDEAFRGGTAVVMEVKTGEIRAFANYMRDSRGKFSEIYNYAITERGEPGSTFKLVTLIALLEDGHVDLNTIVDTESERGYRYAGYTYTDESGPYGLMSLLKATAKSSNIAFVKLVLQYYKGKENEFIKHIQRMGLDSPLKLQIKAKEGATHIPHLHNPSTWSKLSLPHTSIGYELMITPMQTLTLYNAVANNGKMIKPKFVTEIQRHGQTIKAFDKDSVICSSICSPATLEKVKLALEMVVAEGTARHIKSNTYKIAGKTGTSQILDEYTYTDKNGKTRTEKRHSARINGKTIKRHQASFAGYFPADDPKYTAIVVLYTNKTEKNFYGSAWAAPVFKEFADVIYASHPEWHNVISRPSVLTDLPKVKGGKSDEIKSVLNELNIPSNMAANTEWARTTNANGKIETVNTSIHETVPSVINMGLKEAIYILENIGLNVEITGKGAVKSQSIQPGTKIVKGQNIKLILEV